MKIAACGCIRTPRITWGMLLYIGFTEISTQIVDQILDPTTQANLIAASGILAGLKLEDEVIYRILRRDIMQESTVYRSIWREAKEEKTREIAFNLLREGLSVETVARCTELSVEEVQQLQQQINESSQN